MKLLPKSSLDSSFLGRGTERGRGYFEESDPKQELFSEREQRGRRGRETERESSMRCIRPISKRKRVTEKVEREKKGGEEGRKRACENKKRIAYDV